MDASRKFCITRYGEGRFIQPCLNKLTIKSIEENRLMIKADDAVKQSHLGKQLIEERAHTESNSIYTTFDFSLLFEELTGLELVNRAQGGENALRTTFTIEQAQRGLLITECNDSLRRIRQRASRTSEWLSIGSEGKKISLTHRHLFIPYRESSIFQYSLRKRIFSQLKSLPSLIVAELTEQVEVDIEHFSELSAQFDKALEQPILPMPRFKDAEGEEVQTDYGVTIHRSQDFEVDESLLHYAPKFFAVLRQDLFLERVFIAYLLKNLDSLANHEQNCIGLLLDIQLYVELPVIDEMLAKTKPLDIDILRQASLFIAETLKKPYRVLSSLRAHLIEQHSFVLFTHVKRALTEQYMAWLNDVDRYCQSRLFSQQYRNIISHENSTVQNLENLLASLPYPENIIGWCDILLPLYDLVSIIKQPITFEIEKADSEQKNIIEQHNKLCDVLEAFEALPLMIRKAEWLTQLYRQVAHSPDTKSAFDRLVTKNALDNILSAYCEANSDYDRVAVLLNAYPSAEPLVIASLFNAMTGIPLNAEIASFLKEIFFSVEFENDLKKNAEYLLSKKENENTEILFQSGHFCIIYAENGKLLADYSADKKIKAFSLLFGRLESRQMLTLAFRTDGTIRKTHTLVRGQHKVEHCIRIKAEAQEWVDALRNSMNSTLVFLGERSPSKKERSLSYSGSPSKFTANSSVF